MDPVLNQTPTTTRTTYGQTLTTKDYSNWSDRELRKELKKYGEKLPRETERTQLLSRLQFHENQKTVSPSQSHPLSSPVSEYPIPSVPISSPKLMNKSTKPNTIVTQTTRNYDKWTEKELRTELKKHGEKVPKDTDRTELIRRLNLHEIPIESYHKGNQDSILVTERTRNYKDFSDRELRKELKKFGEKVPRQTERTELLRLLALREQPIQTTVSTPLRTGTTSNTVITQKSRDFNNWSEKELRTELKRFGEKVSKDTDRTELIRRLNLHEPQTVQSGQSIQSNKVLVNEKKYKDLSDRELRKELKRYGEKVPRKTERAELLRRLDVHERSSHVPISSPVKSTVPIIGTTYLPTQTHSVSPINRSTVPTQQTIPQQTFPIQQTVPSTFVITEDTKRYNNWSEKQMRRELRKFGDRVPKNTQRMEMIRRLNCYENHQKLTGYTRITGLPIQNQQYPIQQNNQQQFHQHLPQQQYHQTGYSQQCQQQCPVLQQNQQTGYLQQQYPVQQNNQQQCHQTGYPQQQCQQQCPVLQQNIPQQYHQTGYPQQQCQQQCPVLQQNQQTGVPQQQSHSENPQQQGQHFSNHRCVHPETNNHN